MSETLLQLVSLRAQPMRSVVRRRLCVTKARIKRRDCLGKVRRWGVGSSHVLLLGAVVVSTGCSDFIAPPDCDSFGPPDMLRGKELHVGWAPRPAWSVDGDHLFIYDVYVEQMYSVDVASEDLSVIASVPRGFNGPDDMKTGLSGSYVYLAVPRTTGYCYGVYMIPTRGGVPELVADSLDWPWFAISEDENRLAVYPVCDTPELASLGVYDRIAQQLIPVPYLVTYLGDVMSLSPDGQLFVYGDTRALPDSVAPFHVFDLATQTEVAAPTFEPTEGGSLLMGPVRWFGSDPRILVVERQPDAPEIELSIVSLLSGSRESYGSVPAGDEPAGWVRQVAWSSQGAVAVWIAEAIGPKCTVLGYEANLIHWRLYGLKEAHAAPQLLAETVHQQGASWLEFSPDGTRLGFVLFGRLYVLDEW